MESQFFFKEPLVQNGDVEILGVVLTDHLRRSFRDGVSLKGEPPPKVVFSSFKRRWVDFPWARGYSVPVVSDRVRQTMERFDVEAEFLPIEAMVQSSKRKVEPVYWFLNILSVLDCIDLERSDLAEPGNFWSPIRKMVFKEDVVRGKHLFRATRGNVSIWFSRALRDALVEQNATGIRLVPVEAYTLA